jgi:hypothetical protein
MAKKLTVNEMIYKTLTTKVSKIPKYKDELEALGYKLNSTHAWSTYDYWGIETGIPGRILLISSGYDKKKRLYKTAKHIKTKDITKVDFENLIKTNRESFNQVHASRITQYKQTKMCYKTGLAILEDKKKEYEQARLSLEYWEKSVQKDKQTLDEIVTSYKK